MLRLRQIAPNITELEVHRAAVTLWWSYETPLAVMAPGVGIIVNADCAEHGVTSAKHRTRMGWKDRPHISSERFARLCDCVLALDWSQPGAADTLVRFYRDDDDIGRAVA